MIGFGHIPEIIWILKIASSAQITQIALTIHTT